MQRSNSFVPAVQIATTRHEVVSLSKQFQEFWNQPKVIGVIRVTHNEIGSVGAFKPLQIRVAVASKGLFNYTDAHILGDRNRLVGGAVVAHYNFPVNIRGFECTL